MMYKRYSSLFLLLVILSAVVVMAGCTQPSPSAQPGNGSPTVTPTPASTTSIGEGLMLFDKSKFHMFQYDIYASYGSVSARVGQMKNEYDTAPFGNMSDARHMKETKIVGEGNNTTTIVTDLYYNPANNWILGGHVKAISTNGTTEKDIPEDDRNYWNADMATISSNVKFYDEGAELVAVPKGMYPAAKKYTSTDSGVSLWMASGVPVPVKIAGSSTSDGTTITTTMELVNYE